MGILLTIAAIWIVGALVAGVGVGRIISRADHDDEMNGLERELEALTR